MKSLSWNTRGLGNPQEFRTLRDLLVREDPDIIFLQETKVYAPFFTSNKFKHGFQNVFVVDCDGKSGGLTFLWKDDVSLEIINYFVNHIHSQTTLRSTKVISEEKMFSNRDIWSSRADSPT